MRVVLTVIAGPHKGSEFAFDRHDTFLVGRSRHAHFQLPAKDRYFSRIHFMMEVNPPECRLIDMGSHNGTYVNGTQVLSADLQDGDQIRAGHTILNVRVLRDAAPVDAGPSTVSFDEASAYLGALPTIPGYALERELGRGAMGVTYLGRRGDDPTLYAVKVVKPSFQGSPGQINDFLRAARALVKLGHPNLIPLCEIGGCPSGFYFVSDFFPGQSAAEIVQRDGPFPIVRLVRWANQLLQALSYAHEKKLVHSDIKPANIVAAKIDGKEIVKLSDYAVARVYQAAPFSGLSVTASLLSLASFMPPELLFNYQDVNPLSDQYSIAAVLYHLLTGGEVIDLPGDERKKFSSVLRHQYTPLSERRTDVPAALADAIHKALSRSPSQRFKDVAQFRQAILRAVQAG